MEKNVILHLLQSMIDFFEAGNRQSDGAAKAIIESDSEYPEYWQKEIKRFKAEGEWTGLRGPEAEIIGKTLGAVKNMLID